MQTLDLGLTKVWFANEFLPQQEKDPAFFAQYIELLAREFFRRRLFKELVELHAQRNGLEGYAVLEAHAGSIGNSRRYYFWDNGWCYPVQDWIDKVDGEFAALLILACGTKRGRVSSQRSVVIHPTTTASGIVAMMRSKACLRLYLPGTGYLGDNPYRLRKAVDSLKGVQ